MYDATGKTLRARTIGYIGINPKSSNNPKLENYQGFPPFLVFQSPGADGELSGFYGPKDEQDTNYQPNLTAEQRATIEANIQNSYDNIAKKLGSISTTEDKQSDNDKEDSTILSKILSKSYKSIEKSFLNLVSLIMINEGLGSDLNLVLKYLENNYFGLRIKNFGLFTNSL